jgi:C-terminal processing protease CtpA/Prc
MKLMKALTVVVVLAGLVALGLALARPAYSQAPPGADRQWFPEWSLLEGSGSQIGVTARDLEPADFERLKVDGGVLIDTVRPDSPAAKAGLRTSDIVVEFDGERVRSLRQFTRLVRESPPDRAIRTTVLRDGTRTSLSITPVAGGGELTFDGRELRERVERTLDDEKLREQIEAFTARIPRFDFDLQGGARGRLGVTVQELTPDLAAYFGAADGVLVAAVVENSPAFRAGLKAGDVIASVNGRSVGSTNDLVRELRGVTGTGEVTLGIVRDKKESSLKATIDVQPERRARPVRPIRRSIGQATV